MRLGIDFGTTRTIVAWADRGNYPVVSFTDHLGDHRDYIPSVAAWLGEEPVFGEVALQAAADGGQLSKSFKRALAAPDVNADTMVEISGRPVLLLDVLTGFAAHVREALQSSNIAAAVKKAKRLEAVIAVPAHAHGAQRFLTLEAFQRAGFEVTAMLNEPSAAGFEYSHRQGRTLNSKRTRVLVYDLGGGTFDVSLVNVDGTSHEVLGSLGVNRLGGDDFDAALAECALEVAGVERSDLAAAEWQRLLEQCRDAKERISPQTRRVALDVNGKAADVQVDDFYKAASPLVDQTVAAMAPLVSGFDEGADGTIAGIYLVGGGSGLPLVPRTLRGQFGRRVHRSPHPAASTAIGLAIAGDESAGYSLTDRLSRGFGVFREADAGRTLSFDAIITPDQRVTPRSHGQLRRRYRAAHNVGWFRFVEFTSLDSAGQPLGDLVPFGEMLFAFDPALQGTDLAEVQIERTEHGPIIEETYHIDPHGIVHVTVTDLDSGHEQVVALRAK